MEWLCYVLEPNRLCEPVTGKKYVPFNEETASEDDFIEHQKFMRHCQLADYFVAQLQLLTNMAKGRSYNCIDWLTRSDGFSYTMLIGMAANPWLPYSVRSTVIYLLLALYVDRYPQLGNSGRPSIPEVLWIAAELKGGQPNPVEKPQGGVPRIMPIELKDQAALPRFSLSESHNFFGNDDPALGLSDDFKFYLLRRLANDIVDSFGGNMVVSNGDENRLACAALSASSMLLGFGFQSTYEKLRGLLVPSATIMDGRSDEASPGKMFTPSAARYEDTGSADYQAAVTAKKKVIALLSDVSDYRANFRLARLLHYFHTLYQSGKGDVRNLRDFAAEVDDPNVEPNVGNPILDTIYKEFEKMFLKGDDAMKLDLAAITEQPGFGDILLDCVMYDDDELFEESLKLLDRRFGQRRKLLEVVGKVYLLDKDTIPVFGTVHTLYTKLGFLLYTMRSTENWGVYSKVSGDFDKDRFQHLKVVCKDLIRFLQARSSPSIDGEADSDDEVTGFERQESTSFDKEMLTMAKHDGETRGSPKASWGLTATRRDSYSLEKSPLDARQSMVLESRRSKRRRKRGL